MNRPVRGGSRKTFTERCTLLALLSLIIILPSVSHAGAKEQIIDAYEYRQGFLKSFRLRYTTRFQTLFPDDQRQDVTREWVYYAKNAKRAEKVAIIDKVTGKLRRTDWKVANDKFIRRLLFGNDRPVRGTIRAATEPGRMEIGLASPIAFAGLQKVQTPPGGYIGGSQDCDVTVLMKMPNVHVLPETEEVNGHTCYVVATMWGKDYDARHTKKWFAKDLNFALVKVERYDPGSQLKSRRVFDGFVEIAPEFFLAHAIRAEVYYVPYWRQPSLPVGGYELRHQPVQINTYTISSVELNPDIPDSEFELEFPDGVVVEDERSWLRRRLLPAEPPKLRKPRTVIGTGAPELDVAEWVKGTPKTLDALRGKMVVLALWDHTDEACAELVSLLDGQFSEYSEKGVEIISIHSADAKLGTLKKFLSDNSIEFRVAVDKPAENCKGATFEKYYVREVPAVFIIDAEGKVRYQDIPLAAVEEAVKNLLDEQ
jgi:peroxiredoxin